MWGAGSTSSSRATSPVDAPGQHRDLAAARATAPAAEAPAPGPEEAGSEGPSAVPTAPEGGESAAAPHPDDGEVDSSRSSGGRTGSSSHASRRARWTEEECRHYVSQMNVADLRTEGTVHCFLEDALSCTDLPPPWTARRDRKARLYFANKETREPSWRHPLDGILPDLATIFREVAELSDGERDARVRQIHTAWTQAAQQEHAQWHSATSSDGQEYYYNDKTHETTWSTPDETVYPKYTAILQAVAKLIDPKYLVRLQKAAEEAEAAAEPAQQEHAPQAPETSKPPLPPQKAAPPQYDAEHNGPRGADGRVDGDAAAAEDARGSDAAPAASLEEEGSFVQPAGEGAVEEERPGGAAPAAPDPAVAAALAVDEAVASAAHELVWRPGVVREATLGRYPALSEAPWLHPAAYGPRLGLGTGEAGGTDGAILDLMSPSFTLDLPLPWVLQQHPSGESVEYVHPGFLPPVRTEDHPLHLVHKDMVRALRAAANHGRNLQTPDVRSKLTRLVKRVVGPEFLSGFGLWEATRTPSASSTAPVAYRDQAGRTRTDDPRVAAASQVGMALAALRAVWERAMGPALAAEPFPLSADDAWAEADKLAQAVFRGPDEERSPCSWGTPGGERPPGLSASLAERAAEEEASAAREAAAAEASEAAAAAKAAASAEAAAEAVASAHAAERDESKAAYAEEREMRMQLEADLSKLVAAQQEWQQESDRRRVASETQNHCLEEKLQELASHQRQSIEEVAEQLSIAEEKHLSRSEKMMGSRDVERAEWQAQLKELMDSQQQQALEAQRQGELAQQLLEAHRREAVEERQRAAEDRAALQAVWEERSRWLEKEARETAESHESNMEAQLAAMRTQIEASSRAQERQRQPQTMPQQQPRQASAMQQTRQAAERPQSRTAPGTRVQGRGTAGAEDGAYETDDFEEPEPTSSVSDGQPADDEHDDAFRMFDAMMANSDVTDNNSSVVAGGDKTPLADGCGGMPAFSQPSRRHAAGSAAAAAAALRNRSKGGVAHELLQQRAAGESMQATMRAQLTEVAEVADMLAQMKAKADQDTRNHHRAMESVIQQECAQQRLASEVRESFEIQRLAIGEAQAKMELSVRNHMDEALTAARSRDRASPCTAKAEAAAEMARVHFEERMSSTLEAQRKEIQEHKVAMAETIRSEVSEAIAPVLKRADAAERERADALRRAKDTEDVERRRASLEMQELRRTEAQTLDAQRKTEQAVQSRLSESIEMLKAQAKDSTRILEEAAEKSRRAEKEHRLQLDDERERQRREERAAQRRLEEIEGRQRRMMEDRQRLEEELRRQRDQEMSRREEDLRRQMELKAEAREMQWRAEHQELKYKAEMRQREWEADWQAAMSLTGSHLLRQGKAGDGIAAKGGKRRAKKTLSRPQSAPDLWQKRSPPKLDVSNGSGCGDLPEPEPMEVGDSNEQHTTKGGRSSHPASPAKPINLSGASTSFGRPLSATNLSSSRSFGSLPQSRPQSSTTRRQPTSALLRAAGGAANARSGRSQARAGAPSRRSLASEIAADLADITPNDIITANPPGDFVLGVVLGTKPRPHTRMRGEAGARQQPHQKFGRKRDDGLRGPSATRGAPRQAGGRPASATLNEVCHAYPEVSRILSLHGRG